MSSDSSLALNSKEEDQLAGSAKSQSDVLYEELLKTFECPICFKYMTSTIHNCVAGHSICSDCKQQGITCPVCRAELSTARNYMAEEMTKHILFPCKNKDRGCTMRVLGPEVEQHQVNCSHRIYKCPKVCTWTGGRDQLTKHYTDAHPKSIFHSTSLWWRVPRSFKGTNKFYDLLCAYGELFLFYGYGDPNKRYLTSCVHYIGDAEKASMFMYTATLKSEDGSRSLCYTDVAKNDSSDLDTTTPPIELFFASQDTYKIFAHKDGKVHISIEISEKA